ncbi:MAG: hypothetical protein ACOCRX_03185 [Candidatus Woesearchaeota archaeon]
MYKADLLKTDEDKRGGNIYSNSINNPDENIYKIQQLEYKYNLKISSLPNGNLSIASNTVKCDFWVALIKHNGYKLIHKNSRNGTKRDEFHSQKEFKNLDNLCEYINNHNKFVKSGRMTKRVKRLNRIYNFRPTF